MRTRPRTHRPCRIRLELWIVLLVGALCAVASGARAADRPLAGRSLKISQSAAGARLVFVSRDPSVLVPPIGSADDPATGSPGGAVVEIFAQTEPMQTLNAPAGLGNPGWKVLDGDNRSYLYRSTAPSIRKILLREDRLLKVLSD